MVSQEACQQAEQNYIAGLNLLISQLCGDCPVRNWSAQVEMESFGISEASPESDRANLALHRGQLLSSIAVAGQVRQLIGCEGRQVSEEPCECCGNEANCAALLNANELYEDASEND